MLLIHVWPQGGRSWIWVRFWERVRPAKRTAVRMKRCMVFVSVLVELMCLVDGLSEVTIERFTE